MATPYSYFVQLAENPLCCPPLPGSHDPYRTPGWTFAQEWRAHIESTLTNDLEAAENPGVIVIY